MTSTSSAIDEASSIAKADAPAKLSVLIADKFKESGLDSLKDLGCSIIFEPQLTADNLEAAVKQHDPDVIIVRSTKVTASALKAAASLSLIIRAGAGYDTIDTKTASSRGVFVANCPGKNSVAVAELTWALILSCDRRVPDQTIELRAGKWSKKEYSKAAGLYGKTLGIVGLGKIGQEVAVRGKAFGMIVVAWSRSLTQEKADSLGVGFCSNLINLAKMSDVVSINIASTPDTAKLIDEKFCGALKEGAYIINTSRGSVVDQGALTAAIKEKGIRLGLDVYANEPAATENTFADPIANEPGVYGTHHIGASTDQAQQAIADEVVRIVQLYVDSGEVPNCVNRALSTTATTLLTIRHLNKPGVLAHVFYTLGQASINVEEMENIIYDGAEAACARIQLDDLPDESEISAIRSNDNVLSVTVSSLTS
ncbi:MAG: hydroxyacid dehydrogenase [Planctomycetes bacterium]|nr:hydroxyacid dehydrogenase [Planctomycetota bacterium]